MTNQNLDKSTAYKKAGVDIEAGNQFVDQIRPLIEKTKRSEVLSKMGHYAGLFQIDKERYKNPVLVSSTDGVGTKLKLAIEMNKYDTIGVDLVAMCVNDILCLGGEPLFFLDYMASHSLNLKNGAAIVAGVADGCLQSKCALIGGETAEMPILYRKGDLDLAGFAVGIVEKDKIIDGSSVAIGHKIIGIASSGLHSNGYSLVHKIIADKKATLDMKLPGLEKTLGETLLTPTKIYVSSVAALKKEFELFGIAHITGGGLLENIPRILPERCQAQIQASSWTVPPIFKWLQEKGKISDTEMQQVFNGGIGLALVVQEKDVIDILERLAGLGEKAWLIGDVVKRNDGDVPLTIKH